jgi:hypothetical protein
MERRVVGNLQFAIQNFFQAILFLTIAVSASSIFAEEQKKTIIPFDFVSKFDDGRYGQMVGDMILKKLDREGGFILPESMEDVRDYCQRHHIRPSPDVSLQEMKKIVKDDFGGQIGIWGSVERSPGEQGEIYDLIIKCVDFSVEPEPKVIYQTQSRTKSVSEIPHLYVKQMLDAIYNRQSSAPSSIDPVAEANWKNNPNLIVGGDFQTGLGGVPKGWQPVAGQKREPLGNLVQWVAEDDNPSNKIIRFIFDPAVGNEEGVMYYSDWYLIENGAKYRLQCRWKSTGPEVKAFIKCYDELTESYKAEPDESISAEESRRLGKDNYSSETSRREVYRSQQNLKGPLKTWNIHTEDFTPGHPRYSPKWGRVMLYAYHGGGQVDFDDVVVKQILPPDKRSKQK